MFELGDSDKNNDMMELLAMSYGCILQPNKAVSALLGGWGQGFPRWLIRVVEQKPHGRRSPIAGDL